MGTQIIRRGSTRGPDDPRPTLNPSPGRRGGTLIFVDGKLVSSRRGSVSSNLNSTLQPTPTEIARQQSLPSNLRFLSSQEVASGQSQQSFGGRSESRPTRERPSTVTPTTTPNQSFPTQTPTIAPTGVGSSSFLGGNVLQRVAGGESVEQVKQSIPGVKITKDPTFILGGLVRTPSEVRDEKKQSFRETFAVAPETKTRIEQFKTTKNALGTKSALTELVFGTPKPTPTQKVGLVPPFTIGLLKERFFPKLSGGTAAEKESLLKERVSEEFTPVSFAPLSTPTGPEIVGRTKKGEDIFFTADETKRTEGSESITTLKPTGDVAFTPFTEKVIKKRIKTIEKDIGAGFTPEQKSEARGRAFGRGILTTAELAFGAPGFAVALAGTTQEKDVITPTSAKVIEFGTPLAIGGAIFGTEKLLSTKTGQKFVTSFKTKTVNVIDTKFPRVEFEESAFERIAPVIGDTSKKELFQVTAVSKTGRRSNLISAESRLGNIFTTSGGKSPIDIGFSKGFSFSRSLKRGGFVKTGIIGLERTGARTIEARGRIEIAEAKPRTFFQRGLSIRTGVGSSRDVTKNIEVIRTGTSLIERRAGLIGGGKPTKSLKPIKIRKGAVIKGDSFSQVSMKQRVGTRFELGKPISADVEAKIKIDEGLKLKSQFVTKSTIQDRSFFGIGKSQSAIFTTEFEEIGRGLSKGVIAERLKPGEFGAPIESVSTGSVFRKLKLKDDLPFESKGLSGGTQTSNQILGLTQQEVGLLQETVKSVPVSTLKTSKVSSKAIVSLKPRTIISFSKSDFAGTGQFERTETQLVLKGGPRGAELKTQPIFENFQVLSRASSSRTAPKQFKVATRTGFKPGVVQGNVFNVKSTQAQVTSTASATALATIQKTDTTNILLLKEFENFAPTNTFSNVPFITSLTTKLPAFAALPFIPLGGGGGRKTKRKVKLSTSKTRYNPSLIGVEFQKKFKAITPKQAKVRLSTGVGIRPVIRGRAPRVNRI